MADAVIHFELPADNLKRAQAFYEKCFGWKAETAEGMPYVLWQTTPTTKQGMPERAGAINGGMLARQDPIQAPVITLGVDDMDEALAKVEAAGGRIVREKQDIGPIGSAAYVQDTEGNVIGLFEGAM